MLIHFIHRIDNSNIGDMSCCPLDYFDFFKKFKIIKHDIYNIDFTIIMANDIVILGGGGLFDCLEEWNQNINKILDICNNVIAWGVGFNTHHGTTVATKINFTKFKLLSIRDFNHHTNFDFVPCCSCLINFPKNKNIRKIGILKHHSFYINTNYPSITNNVSLTEFLNFISETEIILTGTYHGWYWATLMGKKVILINPFSNKFDYLPFKPVIYSNNIERDCKIAICYEKAMETSIKLNISFYKQVKKLIKKNNTNKYPKLLIRILSCFIPTKKKRHDLLKKYSR